jgi:hypothetical protein
MAEVVRRAAVVAADGQFAARVAQGQWSSATRPSRPPRWSSNGCMKVCLAALMRFGCRTGYRGATALKLEEQFQTHWRSWITTLLQINHQKWKSYGPG